MKIRRAVDSGTEVFSVPGRILKHQLHQLVSRAARCAECFTMQDRAELIHAKLPHEFHADLPGLVRAQTTEFEPEGDRRAAEGSEIPAYEIRAERSPAQ